MAKSSNGNSYEARRLRARRGGAKRTKRGGSSGTAPTRFPRWMLALIGLAGVGFIAMTAVVVAAIITYRNYADELVAPDEFAINRPSYGAKIYDRNGKFLYEYVDDKAGLRRPIGLDDISPAFLAATIATEDDSFFTNPGINIKGLVRAAWENSPFAGGGDLFEGSGGSSITQQLVKNVYIPEEERQERSVSRKLKETVYALELTQNYSKEKILEWYVNQISYGGLYNGVEAASQGYFGKSAKDLTLAEAAMLAGIPQSPAAYDPVNHPEAAAARRDEVLDLLQSNGRVQIGKDAYYEVNNEEVTAARAVDVSTTIAERRFPIEAPHWVLQYIQPQLVALYGTEALYRDGLIVTTTLDLDLQYEVQADMERRIADYEGRSGSHNGSMMVMDPKKGEILVMVGSRDYFNEELEGKNNNATACNSPGSAFKPFAYLTAFQELGWGPGTLILDTPVQYRQNDGSVFEPDNPSHNYAGPVTMRYSLGNSLNVTAVKTAAAVGPEKIVTNARKMGFMNSFRLTDEGGCASTLAYGPAIATGGVGVTLEEMMFGYTVLANGGVLRGQEPFNPQSRRASERQIDPISILKITDAFGNTRYDVEEHRKEARVVPEEYVYLVSSILSDPSAQCATFGCGGISIPGYRAATKTGTSEPFSPTGPNRGKIGETWAFAYAPELVVGIWAGNSDNSPISNLFSTSISYPAVSDVFQDAASGRSITNFARPANVVDATVCVPSGLKPSPLCGRTTTDIFAKDKVPTTEDNWWQQVRLDIRNGLLAGPTTPPQFVQEQVMLVPPENLMRTDEDKKAMKEWADALKLPLAPTEVSTVTGGVGDVPVLILSPAVGSNVNGVVSVLGRAMSQNFTSYRLEYGSGASPNNWSPISQASTPVDTGVLGIWQTTTLPQGVYTLRLTVTDRTRGQISTTVTVNVGPPNQPGAGPTPQPRP